MILDTVITTIKDKVRTFDTPLVAAIREVSKDTELVTLDQHNKLLELTR